MMIKSGETERIEEEESWPVSRYCPGIRVETEESYETPVSSSSEELIYTNGSDVIYHSPDLGNGN